VTLDGKDHYLGHWSAGCKYPPAEVQAAYDRKIAEWLANGRRLPAPAELKAPVGVTVNELILAFYNHAVQHYRRDDGTYTSEVREFKLALKPLRALYGTLSAVEFGPLKLKAVRQWMVNARLCLVTSFQDGSSWRGWVPEACVRQNAGPNNRWEAQRKGKWLPAEVVGRKQALSRGVINQRIGRLVRVFKWAVAEEMVPEGVWRALTTVRGLEKDRSPARETEPVKPVAEALVYETLPHVLPPVRAMVELQMLTGMRPGEVCVVRACDLDTTGDVWLYRPARHKTRHKGKERIIAIGPRGQQVIKPFLTPNPQAYLFSPRDSIAHFRAEQRARRKTKVQPSQADRRKKRPRKGPGEHYVTTSFARAIATACKKAGLPHWHPHQIRHTHATEVRRRFGIEAAQVTLGHAGADVTQVYAERDMTLATKVAKQMG
jgi:integrase